MKRRKNRNTWMYVCAVVLGLGATALLAHHGVGETEMSVLAGIVGVVVGARAMDRML